MKTKTHESFAKQVEKVNGWLAELQEDLGWSDRHQAYRALRIVLHSLRDRLTVEEVAQLGAQLPMLVRGFYFESWKPHARHVEERHLEAFLSRIERELGQPAGNDAEAVTRAVFGLLQRHISEGEIEDVKAVLPQALLGLWPRPSLAPSGHSL